MDIEKLVAGEAAWLAQQEAGVLQEMLGLYKETAAELEQKLKGMERDSYTRRHTRAIGAQLDVLIQEMGDRQAAVLGKSVQLTFKEQLFREQDAWQGLEQAFGSPEVAKQFAGITPIVPQRAVKALLKATDVSIKGFTDDLSRDVRRTAAKSMLAGEGMKDTIKRVRKVTGSGVAPARLQLISRMETARASNSAKQEYIEQVNKELPELELWQMVKGRVDHSPKTRNHWVTWALSGTVRNVTKGEFFEIHLAAIALVKAQYSQTTGRKATDAGVLMKRFEKGLRCLTIPAHFGDRDTIVGWRPTWGEMAGPVKHPQGPIKMGFDEEDEDEGLTPPPKPEPEPDAQPDSRPSSPKRTGGGNPNDYAQHLPPTAEFRDKPIKEIRALLKADGNLAKAEVKADKEAGKLRREMIRDMAAKRKKEGLNPLEKQFFNKLIDEETNAIDVHYRSIHTMGQEARAAISLPIAESRVAFDFAQDVPQEMRDKAESVGLAFTQMLGERLRPGTIKFKMTQDRPRFVKPDTIEVPEFVHPRYIAHELAHYFETYDRHALQASLKFLDNRCKGKEYLPLNEIDPLNEYDENEYARKGRFTDPYSAKAYFSTRRKEAERSKPRKDFPDEPPTGSEILATGFEQMYQNPALFSVQDPNFFEFIWGIMHGKNTIP